MLVSMLDRFFLLLDFWSFSLFSLLLSLFSCGVMKSWDDEDGKELLGRGRGEGD